MNKEQLEKLSDFEINCLITKHIPVIMEDEQPSKWDTTDFVMVNDIVSMYPLDFCNNWSDMGELIESLWDELNKNVPERVGLNRYVDSTIWKRTMSEYDCGKLRAAAIVYLLMQEDKK